MTAVSAWVVAGMVTTEVQAAEDATVAQRWLLVPLAMAANVTIEGPQAAPVSNNVDGMGDIAGLGRRARLNRGNLGLLAVTVISAVQAAGLLAGTHSRGLTRLAAPQVGFNADTAQIPVEVDGEALVLETPVRRTVRPAALRVRVPRDRPGVPDPKPIMDWKRLWRIALTVRRPVRSRPW
jgi:diacylglycerol kinase family enzyme